MARRQGNNIVQGIRLVDLLKNVLENIRLKKIGKKILTAVLLGTTLLYSSPAKAMPEIMPLTELQEGMTGTGWTVIDSSGEIVPFGVEIIGVIQGGKGTQASIMAKASGPVINASEGIVHGMSGSPIYIDGRLVGAAAAVLKDMDRTMFIITPIEDMLKIWELPDNKKPKKPELVDFKKINEEREKRLKKEAEEKAKKEAAKQEKNDAKKEKETVAEPAKGEEVKDEKKPAGQPENKPSFIMPLDKDKGQTGGKEPDYKSLMFVGGFDPVSYSALDKQLRPLGFKTVPMASFQKDAAGNTVYDASIEPGASFGIAVVHGDFLVGGMGTITAVDGNRILGFGHSMLGKGNVSYFMTETDVLGTIKGYADGMKIGNVKKVIGRINQDRSAGVGGIIGEFPAVVGVRVKVEDKTAKSEKNYAASIAYDETVLPVLANGIAYASLNRTTDSQSESTVKVHFEIMTNAFNDGKVERTNMFYAPADVGQVALAELTEAINLICGNTDKESDLYDIKVELTSENERRTASIISAVPDRPKVRPGDTVIFKTTIKPYRQPPVKLDIPFTVPKNRRDGKYTLDMHGGGLVALPLLMMENNGIINPDAPIPTTEEKIAEFLERNSNNQIIVEPGIAVQLMSEKEQKEAIREAVELSKALEEGKMPAEPPITKFDTDYVIDNVIHAIVEVDKKAPLPEKKADTTDLKAKAGFGLPAMTDVKRTAVDKDNVKKEETNPAEVKKTDEKEPVKPEESKPAEGKKTKEKEAEQVQPSKETEPKAEAPKETDKKDSQKS